MKLIIFILCFSFSNASIAALAELFSGAASTMAVGNQFTANPSDPANNALAPALMAMGKENAFSFNFFGIATNFNKIDNIVVDNDLNSTGGTRLDSYDPNPETQFIVALHGAINFLRHGNAKLLMSVYAPADKLIEVSTGDPYRPEYVMYQSRLQRTVIDFHLANKWNDNWFYSFGFHTGLQSSGETKVIARETGAPFEPSSGSLRVNATPSLSPILSILKVWNPNNQSYLYWQQSMKSQLKNEATGLTPVGSSALRFDWDFKSMLYFDPAVLRLGHQLKYNNWNHFFTLEYQDWSSYQTPKLEMVNNGGILTGSYDYEQVELQNILIPKVGSNYQWGEKILSWGYYYRPSPFKHDLDLAGNSIDANTHVLNLGLSTNFKLGANTFTLNASGQYHQLEKQKVNKTENMENDSAGYKIGAPGYEISGNIYVLSFGLSWVL